MRDSITKIGIFTNMQNFRFPIPIKMHTTFEREREKEMTNTAILTKGISAIIGGVIAYLEPTIHYMLICLFAILLDCFTAWMLDRRVKRNYSIDGVGVKAYFSSRKMSKIFHTMLEIFGIVVLAFLIDEYIFTFADIYLANIVSGAFCMCQIWSVLENVSSENESTWARLLQRIMVNKVARHLDIDITETDLKPRRAKTTKNNQKQPKTT